MFANEFGQGIKADYAVVNVSEDELKALASTAISRLVGREVSDINIMSNRDDLTRELGVVYINVYDDEAEAILEEKGFGDNHYAYTHSLLSVIFGSGSSASLRCDDLATEEVASVIHVFIPFENYINRVHDF